jgi:hypothetical protein
MFITAQVIGFIGTIANIMTIQFKKKKDILFWFVMVNFIFAISFFLLKGYTGSIICLVAGIQPCISYRYEKKGKELPKILIPVFLIISLICGSLAYKTIIDILPILCAVLYTTSILQKKEKYIRIITFFNIISWIIYDAFVGAYTAMISDIFLIISTVIAIVRYDIKNRKDKNI